MSGYRDPGMAAAFGQPGHPIYDSEPDDTYADGAERVLEQTDLARRTLRAFYVNYATLESTTYAPSYAQSSTADTAFHDLDWGLGGGDEPRFMCRVQRLNTAGAASGEERAACRIRVRYKLDAGAGAPVATLAVTDVDGAGENFLVTCPGTGDWTTAEGVGYLPAGYADQEVELRVSVKVYISSGTATFYLAGICIVSDEPAFDTLAAWDFSATTAPAALTYARTGTWYLVDNAAQSHVTPFGASVWGTEVDANGNRYKPVLPGHTNAVADPRDLSAGSWASVGAPVVTANAVAGPDGATLADRVNAASAEARGELSTSGSSAQWAASGWFRAVSGTDETGFGLFEAGGSTRAFNTGNVTTTWSRQTILRTLGGAAATSMQPIDGRDWSGSGGLAAGARDVYVDLLQRVPGVTYAPPYTATTVGATVLSLPGTDVVRSGWFDVLLCSSFQVYEAAATPTADQYLLYLDANNHLRFRASDNKFVLTLHGAEACASSSSHTYNAGEWGGARVWSRSDGCGFWISATGAEAGVGPFISGDVATGAAQDPIDTPATVYLFSNNGANVFPCKVYGRGRARELGPRPWSPEDLGASLYDAWDADDGLSAGEWVGTVNGQTLAPTGVEATVSPGGWTVGKDAIKFFGAERYVKTGSFPPPWEVWISYRVADYPVGADECIWGLGAIALMEGDASSSNDTFAISAGPGLIPGVGPLGDDTNVVVGVMVTSAVDGSNEAPGILSDGSAALASEPQLSFDTFDDLSLAANHPATHYLVRRLLVTTGVLTAAQRARVVAWLQA